MTQQEVLAQRLHGANTAVVDSVRGASPAGWLRPVGNGDSRSAGTLAHHIGVGYGHALAWATSIRARGVMPELTMASIDAENAEDAAAFAYPSPSQVIAFLEAECAELGELVLSLSDLELDTPSRNFVFGRQWTPRDVVETTLRHTERHHREFLETVQAAHTA